MAAHVTGTTSLVHRGVRRSTGEESEMARRRRSRQARRMAMVAVAVPMAVWELEQAAHRLEGRNPGSAWPGRLRQGADWLGGWAPGAAGRSAAPADHHRDPNHHARRPARRDLTLGDTRRWPASSHRPYRRGPSPQAPRQGPPTRSPSSAAARLAWIDRGAGGLVESRQAKGLSEAGWGRRLRVGFTTVGVVRDDPALWRPHRRP
jgi:hypothetical protein